MTAGRLATTSPVTRGGHGAKGVSTPGTIFARSDTPFTGEGTQVSLHAEPGYTQRGKLHVPFRFQLPPHEQIQRTAAFTWSNFDVLDPNQVASERTRPGGRRLRTVNLSAMFLDWEPTFQVWSPDVLDPVLAVRELERISLDGVKFRLRVRNRHYYAHDDVNMVAVLPQVTINEEPGEPDTRYAQLQFMEYEPTEMERKAVRNELGPWTHTIKDGDTLYKLAKRYYHRQSEWKRIAAANKGLEHQPPSHNLLDWSKRHKRKSIRIPQSPAAHVAVAA